jgi:integrase/recombinase XerC
MSESPMLPTLTQSNAIDGNRLIDAFKRGRSANTLAAYAGDLEAFGEHRGLGPGAAVAELLEGSHGQGNATLLEYRATMLEAKLAPATINRRLSAVRSIVKLARQLGITDWRPEVDGVKSESYRDTAGPGLDGTRALLKAAKDQPVLKAKRDAAMVRMLFDMALRREEVASLDLEHLELDRRRVFVLGKGKLERVPITLPVETCLALREWLDWRGTICMAHDKPLFVGLAGPKYGKRLSGKGVWVIITSLGKRVGIRAKPHGLRHASITAVLDASGDLRAGQRHARHASANTTLKYDDNRSDIAGKAAQTIASILTEG